MAAEIIAFPRKYSQSKKRRRKCNQTSSVELFVPPHASTQQKVHLLSLDFALVGILLRDHRQWAEIAVEEGITDPLEALEFFFQRQYRPVFTEGLTNAREMHWHRTKFSSADRVAECANGQELRHD